jgi:hypothetical protein
MGMHVQLVIGGRQHVDPGAVRIGIPVDVAQGLRLELRSAHQLQPGVPGRQVQALLPNPQLLAEEALGGRNSLIAC